MIRAIISASLRFRTLVVAVAAVVLVLGIVQLPHASVDAYPEFTPVQVQVQTEALGLSAAEVEQLITVPMEQDLLNGVPWLDEIRSESVPGLSSIDLVFEPGTDVLAARQAVQERMTQAHALPNVGTPPVILQPLSSTSRVMMIGLSATDLSLIDLSVLARWKIKPRLMGVPGVANVAIWGQRDRQLQVQVDPDRLRQHGVSLSQVITTAGNALWVSPLTFVEASTPGTGGFIDTSTQRFGIQHVLPITTAKSLSGVTIEDTGGRTLRLADVATVVEDHQPLVGDAVLGAPGLMLVIERFPEANPRAVTRAVEDALTALGPGLAGIKVDTTVYRPASFLDRAVGDLATWAVTALILLVVLLLLAFLSWRAALIGLVAIVLSLVAAASVLYLRGAPVNLMVVAGLVAALGFVVGDAIVDVDQVRRRLRESQDRPPADVLVDASAAVRGPATYATLIVLLAPLPMLLLGGVPGSFARPLVLSYALAIVASTVVALTVTPALTLLLARAGRTGLRRRANPFARLAYRGFDRTAPRYLRRPRLAYATMALLVVAAVVAIVPALGERAFLPSVQDREVLIHWQAAPGTSLPEMARITTAVSRELRALPGVRSVGAHVGRAITADQIVNVSSGDLWVGIAGSADYQRTASRIGEVIGGYPGLRAETVTYPEDRLNAVRTGHSEALVVRVYGHDLGTLRDKAREIQHVLGGVDGVVSPTVQRQPEEPTLQVTVDLGAAQRYGIKPGDVRRAAATFFAGLPVGSLYEEQKVFDVVVWGAPAKRYTPTDVQDLVIDTPRGEHVRLGSVAAVRITPSPTVIRHDATSRSVDVTAGLRGRSVESVLRDVKSRVQRVAMPLEYHAEVLGEAASQQGQDRRVLGLGLLVAVGIFLLLEAAVGSMRMAALLFVVLPLAGAGGVVAALFTGGVMSVGALTGLLAVWGIATRDAILLIRDYQRRELSESEVIAATRERVGPVLLTALAAALAVCPLVLIGWSGVLRPLAAVVMGGLVTSTILTLFVLPALYLHVSLRVRGQRPAPISQDGGGHHATS